MKTTAHKCPCRFSRFWFAIAALSLIAGCETSVQRAESELDRGVELYNKNDVSGAIAAFDNAINEKEDFPDAYFRRGIAHSKQGNHALAIVDHQDAVRMNPEYAPYLFARGLAFLCDEQYDEARRDFEAVTRLEPSDEIRAKINEMTALAVEAKKARAGDSATIATVISGSTDPVVRKPWWEVGLLGGSSFARRHPVWSIVLYIFSHVFVANLFLAAFVVGMQGTTKVLNDQEKGTMGCLGILFGAGSYFLAWGYSYWGLWILCGIWTAGIAGNQIKRAEQRLVTNIVKKLESLR